MNTELPLPPGEVSEKILNDPDEKEIEQKMVKTILSMPENV